MNIDARCIFRDFVYESETPRSSVKKYQFLVDFHRSAQCAQTLQIDRFREEPRALFLVFPISRPLQAPIVEFTTFAISHPTLFTMLTCEPRAAQIRRGPLQATSWHFANIPDHLYTGKRTKMNKISTRRGPNSAKHSVGASRQVKFYGAKI